MMNCRLYILALLAFFVAAAAPLTAQAGGFAENATHVRTNDALLGPGEAWDDPSRSPLAKSNEGSATTIWVFPDHSNPVANNILFTQSFLACGVEFFVRDDNGMWSGSFPEGAAITKPTHPAATIMVELPPAYDANSQLAIKITGAVAATNLHDLQLITLEQFSATAENLSLLYKIVLMIVAIAFAYNLFLYLVYKQNFQFYYLIYTTALLLYVWMTSTWIGPVNEWLDAQQQLNVRTVLYSFTAMGVYLFAAEVTRGEFLKPITKALVIAAFLPLTVNVLSFVAPASMGGTLDVLYDVLGPLGIIIFFIGAAIAIPKGGRVSLIVLIAYLLPSAALFIKIYFGYAGYESNFFIHNGVVMATAIENIIMALILVERLLAYKRKIAFDNTL